MKLSDMQTFDEVLVEELEDPDFRARWERSAVARGVAAQVIAYRAEHELTQTALGKLAGMKQPAVARLEAAEHDPNFETLAKLSSSLGIEFNINIHPGTKPSKLATKRALTTAAVSKGAFQNAELAVAAAPV
jgi:transcriptional regulator with XRE-family HTH domain